MFTGDIDVLDLISLDDNHKHHGGISAVFGDNYLLSNNYIFRQVRQIAIDNGFRFVTNRADPLWQRYQLMSLACLADIMVLKCCPCFPTRDMIEHLRSLRMLDKPLSAQFLYASLVQNNHFHEASHALGYIVLDQQSELLRGFSMQEDEQRVWGAILTEALANTIELFAWIDVSSIAEYIFFKCNAPSTYDDPDFRDIVKCAIAASGSNKVFEQIFLSFVTARLDTNVLSAPAQEQLRLIMNDDPQPLIQKYLGQVTLRTARALRREFKDVIAPSYFRMLGLEPAYEIVKASVPCLSHHRVNLRRFCRLCLELIKLE